MENTVENKTIFFALYWGQKYTYKNDFGQYSDLVGDYHFTSHVRNSKAMVLFLKSLEDISDEDLIHVSNIWGLRDNEYFLSHLGKSRLEYAREKVNEKMSFISTSITSVEHIVSYLRSKGYALPWMGLSVEEQIKLGWIKLKTK